MKKEQKTVIINPEFGRVPPQNVQMEEVILGSLMLESKALDEVINILKPESFYKESHQKIYTAILELAKNDEAIDIYTVSECLKRKNELNEIGGEYYLVHLTNKVASAAHVEYHARIVAQKFIQRELIRFSYELQQKAFDDSQDVEDLINFSEAELFKITTGTAKREIQKFGTVVKKAIDEIEIASKNETGLTGIPSGFTALDRITCGFQKTDLIVIAARPSMGKTSLITSIIKLLGIDIDRPVGMFSVEVSSLQIAKKIISDVTDISGHSIRSGDLRQMEWSRLEANLSKMMDAPIYLDDTPAISIMEFRSKCRRMIQQFGVEIIFIDYLQLMTVGSEFKGNREREISYITSSLKATAKELDVPIIALSQLNRNLESRAGDKRPMLSDLRESGSTEQDSDLVIFIHRPEKYGILEDGDGNSTQGIADIIIAKHRNGAVAEIKLRFIEELTRFQDIDLKFDRVLEAQNEQMNSNLFLESNNEF